MARPADPHRREAILRAATELFVEQGFSDTRLADIAQRAGIVISTLYLYFDSKEAMVRAIARENQQALLEQLRPVLEHLHGEADIAQFVETVCAFAREHRDQIRVFSLGNGLSAVRRGVRTTYGPRMQQGIEIVRRLINEGYLRPYDPQFVIEMLINYVRWLVGMYLSLQDDEQEAFRQFCAQWLSHALLRQLEAGG